MTAKRCKCGLMGWAEGYRPGFSVTRSPFGGQPTPTLTAPCSKCGTGPDGEPFDMTEASAMYRGACEVARAR